LDPSEFVTIAEAARRLGIAPRQVRRYAERLKPEDTCRDTIGTGTGKDSVPLRVRFSAVIALRDEGKAQGQGKDTTEDRDRDTVGTVEDSVPALLRDIIARQDAEIANLRASLNKSQENTAAALAELQRANERSAVLIAAVGAGRLQIPAAQTDSGNADSGAAVTLPDVPAVLDDVEVASVEKATTEGDSVKRQGFFQRAFGWMKEH